MDGPNTTGVFAGFLAIVVALLLIRDCNGRSTRRESEIYSNEPVHEVICISERGDTVATFYTRERPYLWTSYGGLTVASFRDTLGKSVELRTRGGTILWQ